MKLSVGNASFEIIEGDITEQHVDAIVNPAKSSLTGGGGVDGAIHRKGGPSISDECKKLRASEWPEGIPTGRAVITSGGRLKAKYVIHTVGPIWHGGHSNEPELLADCYRNSLRLANSKQLTSISFPSISTGAFGYPIKLASIVALKTTSDFLRSGQDFIELVTFVLFTSKDMRIYEESAKLVFRLEV